MKQTHVYQDPLFAPIDLEVAMWAAWRVCELWPLSIFTHYDYDSVITSTYLIDQNTSFKFHTPSLVLFCHIKFQLERPSKMMHFAQHLSQLWSQNMEKKNNDTITVIFDKVDNNFHIWWQKHFTYLPNIWWQKMIDHKKDIVPNLLQLLLRAKRSYGDHLSGAFQRSAVLLIGRSFEGDD